MANNVKRGAEKSFDPADYFNLPYRRVLVPEEDGTFRAEILEFPGCIATGDTEVGALKALKDVAFSWLESVAAMGKAIPEPMENLQYSGKLVLRMPKNLHKKAARAAERDGVSLNQFIVSSVAEQIGMKSAGSTHKQSFAHVVLMPYLVVSSSDFVLGRDDQTRAITAKVTSWQMADLKIPMKPMIGAS